MKRLNLKSIVATLTVAIAGIGLVLASIEKEVAEKSNASPVTIYFDGNPLDQNDVKNAANWSIDNPENDCPAGTRQACAMTVQSTDLNSNGELDPAKITLGASGNSTQGYIPTKTGGSGSNPTFHNRN